jgi:hypothetical protein
MVKEWRGSLLREGTAKATRSKSNNLWTVRCNNILSFKRGPHTVYSLLVNNDHDAVFTP